MNKHTYWKNFNLGKELAVSGSFIYDGLRNLEEIEHLYFEEDSFQFLYYISVGIERLLKVAIILIEHDGVTNQEEFEKSLITHNHQKLIQRIKESRTIHLGKPHNKFINILTDFYKSMRYDRFKLENVGSSGKEKKALQDFISKELNIDFSNDSMMFVTSVDKEIKKLLGNTIGKITSEIYELVNQEAHRLAIYTYEIRHNSKADKIFIRKSYDFLAENRLWKEMLIFAVNNEEKKGVIDLIKDQQSVNFENDSVNNYLKSFSSPLKRLEHLGELQYFYEEELNAKEKKKRFEILDLIGNSKITFDADNDE